MNAPELFDDVQSRTQVQMVGVDQDELGFKVSHHVVGESFDSPLARHGG